MVKLSRLQIALVICWASFCTIASAEQPVDFITALGERESASDYSAVNTLGYLGKYQFGEAALIDLGYYKPDGTPENDWQGVWTGKDGVRNVTEFLASHAAQDKAIKEWIMLLWRYAMDPEFGLDKFLASNIKGITITPAAIIAGAHLVGLNPVKSFLESNGVQDSPDPYGTRVSEYMAHFAWHEICELIQTCDHTASPGRKAPKK
jgi:hypothetical protein